MPPGRKPKQQVELNPAALSQLHEFRTNWGLAMTRLIRIRPRDRSEGEAAVIPFVLRRAQRKAFRDIQLQRSFNILKSMRRHYKAEAENVLCSVLGTSKLPVKAKAICLLILEKRPEWVLHELRSLGYSKATDSPILVLIIKARQLGFSTLIQVLLFLYALFNPRSTVLVVSSDDKSVEHVLSMTATLVDEWPQEFESIRPELTGESRERLELYNKSKYESRSSDGKRIHSITSDANHLTEYAHYKSDDKVAAAIVAVPKHAWIFIESTSAGPAGDYYEKAKSSITIDQAIEDYDAQVPRPERQYIKVFCSWLEDPEYTAFVEPWEVEHIESTLDDYERKLMASFPPGRVDLDGNPLPVCDLGRIKWRREKIKNDCQKGRDRNGRTLSPEQFFMQEYPADEDEAFQEASGAVFPVETILRAETQALSEKLTPYLFRVKDEKTEPVLVVTSHLANLIIWELPIDGRQYSFGADVGRGRGRDNTVIVGCDRMDGTLAREVVHFASNLLSEVQCAHIAAMLLRLYNNAFIVPEVSGPGKAFVNELSRAIGYPHIYMRQQHTKLGGTAVLSDNLGYDTNSRESKDFLVGEFKQALIDGVLLVRTRETFHELRMYQFDDPEDPKSSMNARTGEKDDRVIASAMMNLGRLARFGAPSIRNFKPDNGPDTPAAAPAVPYEYRVADAIAEIYKQVTAPRGRRYRRLDKDKSFSDFTRKWN